jgi:hypothetical protein
MRTTVNIPDAILERAKERCRHDGKTLGELLADGLRVMLFQPSGAPANAPTRLRTFRGHGVRSGIDLDSNAAVLDAMESR